MAINLGDLDNSFGGMKLNDKIKTKKITAKVKKKKEELVNLPIASSLKSSNNSTSSNLPSLPTKTLSSNSKTSELNLPKINQSNNIVPSKNNILPIVKNSNVTNGNKNQGGKIEDLAAAVGATSLNALNQIGKGVLNFSESVLDTGLQVSTSKINPYYWVNSDKLKNDQNLAQELIEKDASQDFLNNQLGYNQKLYNGKTVQETIDDKSLIKSDNLSGSILESVGNMLPSLMTGNELSSLATLGIGSYGNSIEKAYNEGATRDEANIYGGLSAVTEVLTEKMFAGIGGVLGKGSLDSVVTDKLTSKITNETLKKVSKMGLSAAGEGIEEVASDIAQPLILKLSYMKDSNLKKLYSNQNYLEDFVSGALSSVVMQGVTLPVNSQSNVQIKNTSVDENQKVNNIPIVKATIQSDVLPIKTVDKSNIYQATQNDTLNQTNSIYTNLPQRLEQLKEEKNENTLNNQISKLQNQFEESNDNNSSSINNNKIANQIFDTSSLTNEDIRKTSLIDYYQKDNGDIKVILKDSKGNLVNDFTSINQKDATKSLGSDIASYIYSSVTSTAKSINLSNTNQELDNSSFSYKEKQLNIINNSNLAPDEYHTWIRNVNDIKTFKEAFFEDEDYSGMDPDFDEDMANEAIKTGTITVYSSYPIENGVFVSPSKMKASQYAGGDISKLYSKKISINDVAWIDGAEGQYAKLDQQINPINDTKLLAPVNQNIANNQNVDYNTNKGDIYERPNDRRTNEGVFEESISSSRENVEEVYERQFTRSEFRNFEQQAKSRNQTNITSEEQKLVNDIRKQFKKEIVFFDSKGLSYNAGASLENPNIIYISTLYTNPGKIFAAYHEVMESIIFHNQSISDEYIKPIINEIINDVNYNDVKNSFISDQSDLSSISDYMIAKDIFCDIYASKSSGVDLDYNNNLSSMTNETINYTMEKVNSLIKQQILPSKEKANLPDKDFYNQKLNQYKSINRNELSKEAKMIYDQKMKELKLSLTDDPTKESTYNSEEEIKELSTKKQRIEKIEQYRLNAKDYIGDMDKWKDKSLASQKLNTMKRNLMAIMPSDQANDIYNEYFKPITENNALIEKELSKYNKIIKDLNLNAKESIAVQMMGEYKYNPQTMITGLQLDSYLDSNNLDYDKISKSVEVFRNTYDKLFKRVNNVLKEQGYKEIEYKEGYFPHFIEDHGKTIIGKLAEKLGWEFNNQQLPTDIAGLTDQFLPGKKWTSFSQHRTGKITDYNALKGFDNYIRGAMDVIYHTEDIQKLRALENEIRYQHSEKGIKELVDDLYDNETLDQEQQQKLVDDIYNNASSDLGNFVTNLRDYTNNLAGKKSSLDRSTEQFLGRDIYNTMTNITNRVSANMVGLNISSALTNFIPITQAWSQISTPNMFKAIAQSISSNLSNDGLTDKSTYLTNRTNKADRLYKSNLDKATDKAGILFEAIDSFTSNVIVRGKYLENLNNGLSESSAIKNADEFAKSVMAGRSKGDMPTIFNSKNPAVKLLSAFQLEVNNQYGYMFKDLPSDLKDEGISKLIGAFLKMFLGAWLYNKVSSAVTGRKSAFSPIDTIKEIIDTVKNDNFTIYDKLEKNTENIAQELPFIGGLLGGGRLPINAAIPNISTTVESITNLNDKNKRETAINNLKKELLKPLFYVAMPLGGGQLKKTIEGLSMYDEDNEVPGSYTASGKLRFPVNKDILSKTQAAIFGQYSSKNAIEYFDNNNSPLSEKQVEEYKELDISISEYWKYRKDYQSLNEIEADKDSKGKSISGTASGKKAYEIMNNDNYDTEEKDYLLNSLSTSKTKTTVETLKKLGNEVDAYKYYYSLNYDSREDMIEAIDTLKFTGKQLADYNNKVDVSDKNTKKENIINYLLKSELNDQQKGYLYSKTYSETENIINSSIPMDSYLRFELKTKDIQAKLDGKSNIVDSTVNGSKKRQILKVISETTGLTINQKLLLTYLSGYSIKDGEYKGWTSNNARKTVYNYVDGLNISISKKKEILNKAGYKIYKTGKVGW